MKFKIDQKAFKNAFINTMFVAILVAVFMVGFINPFEPEISALVIAGLAILIVLLMFAEKIKVRKLLYWLTIGWFILVTEVILGSLKGAYNVFVQAKKDIFFQENE